MRLWRPRLLRGIADATGFVAKLSTFMFTNFRKGPSAASSPGFGVTLSFGASGCNNGRPASGGRESGWAAELEVKVWRGRAEGEFAAYRVPRLESQTVLDVVTWIQRNLDPSLTYRYA